MTAAQEVKRLLEDAARLAGTDRVSLRILTDQVETVYAELENGDIVVHDGRETFLTLPVRATRTTNRGRLACRAMRLELPEWN